MYYVLYFVYKTFNNIKKSNTNYILIISKFKIDKVNKSFQKTIFRDLLYLVNNISIQSFFSHFSGGMADPAKKVPLFCSIAPLLARALVLRALCTRPATAVGLERATVWGGEQLFMSGVYNRCDKYIPSFYSMRAGDNT